MLGFSPISSSPLADDGSASGIVGVAAIGAVGSVAVSTSALIAAGGLEAVSGVGVTSITTSASVTVSGVLAEGRVGSLVFWSAINPGTGGPWNGVSPDPGNAWTATPTSDTVWTEIAA